MELSAAGLELIKRFEGFRSEVYRDVAGFPTIGYGHRVEPEQSFAAGIDEAQATALLENDVRQAEQAVSMQVKVALNQGQFDALVDFCFNLGAGRLAQSGLLRQLNAGCYQEAGRQLLAWDHAGGRQYAALKQRREAELLLWSAGVDEPAPAAAAQG